jgi:hypothetical protein
VFGRHCARVASLAADAEGDWRARRELHAALAVAPQTNEVGRSAALLAGLFDLVAASGARRIRLLELGASAGLNLLIDHYFYRGDSWQFGVSDSRLQFIDPPKVLFTQGSL